MDMDKAKKLFCADISKLAGVGDCEVTEEENELAIRVGHELTAKARELGIEAIVPASSGLDPEIPSSVGSYCIAPYTMPPAQQAYTVSDNALIEAKLNAMYEQDRAGALGDANTLVVASAASLGYHPNALVTHPRSTGERIILYICGGGFVASDVAELKWHYIRVSEELQMRVFVPRYHTSPTHPFPRALHDVFTAFMYLISQGFEPENITVLGISAGGNIGIALAHLIAMQQEGGVVGQPGR
ncbi:hypothetical protein GGF43_001644, partial [Coemansia sp. RSA 2618]